MLALDLIIQFWALNKGVASQVPYGFGASKRRGTNGEKWGKMGENGEKWGIYFMGNRVNRLGNSPFFPFFPHFFKNLIYFYRIFLRSIGCIFIDQYFRVEVKEQDIRLISSV